MTRPLTARRLRANVRQPAYQRPSVAWRLDCGASLISQSRHPLGGMVLVLIRCGYAGRARGTKSL